ncbi:hypothetical protein EDD86DRAFT_189415 [Gorgonomyces haynaldii]|nr:hypothetical protein EDD86DRAFT_189415 [Gorgonomyces haynaldii]
MSGFDTAKLQSAFSSFTSSLKPLGEQVSRGFTQVSQFAREKAGATQDVTELPPEYRQLEEKVDNIKVIYEQLLKVAKNYTLPHYDYEPDLADRASDFTNFLSTNTTTFAKTLTGQSVQQTSSAQETPSGLSAAFGKAAFTSASLLADEEPFAAALKKFGQTQERMGNFRLQQDQDANLKFYTPMLAAYNTRITEAMKARRHVQSLRLTYDALRARLKSAAPDKADQIRAEAEKSEDEFVGAVDEAMGKMKLVVVNGEPLRCLSDLVAIQLQYHKNVYEALAQLSPELDELVVTNEALYAPAQ